MTVNNFQSQLDGPTEREYVAKEQAFRAAYCPSCGIRVRGFARVFEKES